MFAILLKAWLDRSKWYLWMHNAALSASLLRGRHVHQGTSMTSQYKDQHPWPLLESSAEPPQLLLRNTTTDMPRTVHSQAAITLSKLLSTHHDTHMSPQHQRVLE
jgi:hypothetical protein